jgi:plastocyanin
MRAPRRPVGVLVLASVLIAGCGGGGNDSPRSTDLRGKPAVTIDAVDNRFTPEDVTVSAGTEITFETNGHNDHDVFAVGDTFRRVEAHDLEPGEDATRRFAEPGDYPYYCSLHGTPTKGMRGTIRVVP